MQAARTCSWTGARPMGGAFAPARCVKHVRRAVAVRAVDEDAELEARLAKLKAAKRETTDAEKRQKRQGGGGGKPAGPQKPQYDFANETVFWEGGPAAGNLVFNLALAPTLVWLPLTFGAIGRALFLKYRVTDRRLSVSDTFPGSGKQVDVAFQEVSEVRVVPRVLGSWGDMVVVLRNGDKVEVLSVEKFKEIRDYILQRRDELTGRAPAAGQAPARPSIMDLDAEDSAVGLGGGKPTTRGRGFS